MNKLTCKLDNLRGRKPKTTVSADGPFTNCQFIAYYSSKNAKVNKHSKVKKNNKVKKTNKKATKRRISEDLNEQYVPCIFCGEMFSDSSKEQWIQCVMYVSRRMQQWREFSTLYV